MRYSTGSVGRVFVIRLEPGDRLPECIERLAEEEGVRLGQAVLIGGAGPGEVVVGPRRTNELPPEPMTLPLDGAHEVVGIGVLAPGPDGTPSFHVHAALGRAGSTVTGCLRPGVDAWTVCEVVLYEITGAEARREADARTGFALLEP